MGKTFEVPDGIGALAASHPSVSGIAGVCLDHASRCPKKRLIGVTRVAKPDAALPLHVELVSVLFLLLDGVTVASRPS